MDKKTKTIVIFIGIFVLILWFFGGSSKLKPDLSDSSVGSLPSPVMPDGVSPIGPVQIQKIDNQKVFYLSQEKENFAVVDRDTQIIKLVEEKGFFKDVKIALSDLKPSQIVEIKITAEGQAQIIRVLQ